MAKAKKAKKATSSLKITQVRSRIGSKKNQLATLKGLGLGRIGSTVVRIDEPCIRGMVATVSHLVEVERIEE